jgi:hypothetical protein
MSALSFWGCSIGCSVASISTIASTVSLARQIDGRPNLIAILWLLAQIVEEKEDLVTALDLYNRLYRE